MTANTVNARPQYRCIHAIVRWLRGFWGKEELQVLGINLALHVTVQLLALQFMPLPYYSRLSLHDGNTYYLISENLWPEQPFTLLSWHKRILLPVLADVVFPWNKEMSFLIIGIVAASLSAVFFYKTARRYSTNSFQLTLFYSVLPWLLFAAHHSLSEPLMMLFLLAGYYYFLEDRPWVYTACFALALLSKELAALPILAMGVLIWRRDGWRRAVALAPSVLPFAAFCVLYGLHWGDCAWCLKESPENPLENSFSIKTGLWWIYLTLRTGTLSSANPVVARIYDVGNQLLNMTLLLATAVGIWRLRRLDTGLLLYNAIVAAPLLLLGRNQYMLNSSLGRQFLITSLAILGFDSLFSREKAKGAGILQALLVPLAWAGMLLLGTFWTVLYARFFLYHRLF